MAEKTQATTRCLFCFWKTPYRLCKAQSLGSRVASSVDMDKCLAWIATFLCLLLLVEAMAEASPYSVAGDDLDDYNDNLARLLFFTRKRSCIRRGGSCDHRPNDCCYNSSCRCNLWGTNCRCQRMGLFQKWGKK
ncbi:toxin Tbo-IT2-like isoform X2 [Dermacentor silvarum]|nr:toxin Tbo-IT2-like isoform X2 [Dermacentor silvarum]